MEIRDKINKILQNYKKDEINIDEAINSLIVLFNIEPYIILTQNWTEDSSNKTGWSTWGWFLENGNIFDEVGYEIEEILEKDKFGHITKARFKYVG